MLTLRRRPPTEPESPSPKAPRVHQPRPYVVERLDGAQEGRDPTLVPPVWVKELGPYRSTAEALKGIRHAAEKPGRYRIVRVCWEDDVELMRTARVQR